MKAGLAEEVQVAKVEVKPVQPPSNLPGGGRFVALDSLRGIAALGVAVYHLQGRGQLPVQSGSDLFALPFFANGYLFVDFFFVLSGFVIAAAYGQRLATGLSIRKYMFLRL